MPGVLTFRAIMLGGELWVSQEPGYDGFNAVEGNDRLCPRLSYAADIW